jgi:hypothetical protein
MAEPPAIDQLAAPAAQAALAPLIDGSFTLETRIDGQGDAGRSATPNLSGPALAARLPVSGTAVMQSRNNNDVTIGKKLRCLAMRHV